MTSLTFAVRYLLAHIEKGEVRDSFGRSCMGTLCGTRVYGGVGEQTGLTDPMFYQVCGNCRRILRLKVAKEGGAK